MAKEGSFDIVSEVDVQEMNNVINQTKKEIVQRFDLKDSGIKVDWDGKELVNISGPDDTKVKNVIQVIQDKCIKRGISPKSLTVGELERALGAGTKVEIGIQQGIEKDMAKKINKMIKNTKIKVNSQIQNDQIRVTGKKRDDLQEIIKILKAEELDIDLQFINYR